MKKGKNILVCPLDWGLGHATRLVPVIDLLLRKNHNVIIGADKRPLQFLKQRFPGCENIVIPGYHVRYPKNGNMGLFMMMAYPKMMRQANKSKQILKEIISEKKIDIIISDNRYELANNNVYSILITHQLNIQTPGLLKIISPIIQGKLKTFFKNFNEIWIPDVEGENNLSGKLSRLKKFPDKKFYFVGPLSRFVLLPRKEIEKKYDLLILLSGPEPQRTILENKLINQAMKSGLKTVVLQGKPELSEEKQEKNIRIISHLPDNELAEIIKSSQHIICRSGYTTIM
ncbi:MAG TPA: glycosyltransferase family protein, partial [Bacteroidales bacterium]